MSRTYRVGYLKYAVLLMAAAFSTLPALAATLTVTNLNDSGTGSLRTAMTAPPNGSIINFQPGLTGTISLLSALPAISNDLTISGPGASILAVSGNNSFTLFTINGSTVSISGLTIENGKPDGIFNNAGTLTVTNSTISGNRATGGDGGGIADDGTMTVMNSTISGNTAPGNGGGIYTADN